MLMERNCLMEYVYPKIKEYCREKHGLEYQVNPDGEKSVKMPHAQVVDMRWGVRDEMTDEHMTTVRAPCMELSSFDNYVSGPLHE